MRNIHRSGTLLLLLIAYNVRFFNIKKVGSRFESETGCDLPEKVPDPVLQYLSSGLCSGAASWGSWLAWSGSLAPPCSYLERSAHRMAHLQNVDSHNVQYNELLKVVYSTVSKRGSEVGRRRESTVAEFIDP